MRASLFVALLLALLPAVTLAASRSVTLSVPTMDCPVCPITVKKALTRVSGVTAAEVSFEKREAKVTFDDTKTDVEALQRATRDAGYPSNVVGTPR